MRKCRCSSGSSSCASRLTISTSSSRFASPASSSASSSARISRAPTGSIITEQLQAIHDRTRRLVDAQYACLNDDPAAGAAPARASNYSRAPPGTAPTAQWLEQYFEREVEPVLSPLGLDPARPFPRIQNKSLNFIVRLAGKDAFGRDTGLAIVQAPRSLPRVVALPEDDGRKRFVLLTGIVQQFVSKLFSGMEVLGCYQFRVTRNSDLFVDDEEVDDLRRALEGELAHRRYGAAVRLEVSRDCPPDLDAFLMRQFALSEVDFYEVSGPGQSEPARRPSTIWCSARTSSIRSSRRACRGASPARPTCWPSSGRKTCCCTTRSTASDRCSISCAAPPPIRACSPSSRRCTAPATNHRSSTRWSPRRSPARTSRSSSNCARASTRKPTSSCRTGCRKPARTSCTAWSDSRPTAKMSMVVRREADGLRRYCHLGTGNYHPRTARGYTDYSLFTCDPEIGQDVHELFLQLTSLTQTPRLTKLLQSPFGLHEAMVEKIEREAQLAAAGKPARIIAKMNSLVDPQVIEALYRASRAGVQIDLIIRGLCALRPGIPGVSENIRVRSIVGRFLEHSRVFYLRQRRRKRAVSRQRRLDGAQFLPARGDRFPGARADPSRAHPARPQLLSRPTTRRPGRWDATGATRAANAATNRCATRRAICSRDTQPAAPRSSCPRMTALLRREDAQPETDALEVLDFRAAGRRPSAGDRRASRAENAAPANRRARSA